jgi:hypothetical protein
MTTAAISRALLHSGGPSAVTGKTMTATTTIGQARRTQTGPRTGSSAASTSQT